MELNTKESGISILTIDMVEVTKSGVMVRSMRVTGKLTKLMAEVDLFMLMVISMMDIGKMTKLMALVNTLTLMEPSMKVNGSTISNTAKEKKNGQMVLSTKETTNSVKKMDLESSCGLIDRPTKVTF